MDSPGLRRPHRARRLPVMAAVVPLALAPGLAPASTHARGPVAAPSAPAADTAPPPPSTIPATSSPDPGSSAAASATDETAAPPPESIAPSERDPPPGEPAAAAAVLAPTTTDVQAPAADAATPAGGDAIPERLPPLQQAGWWTLFGGFVLGTTAGVFGGLAERQEDEATRMAVGFDGNSQPLYAERQSEYEQLLRRGRGFQTTAIVLGSFTAVAIAAGAALFVVDARRRNKKSGARARLAPSVHGIELRF